jgi:SIR2-like domain
MLNMSEGDWRRLLGRIKEGRCTPFLGAGAGAGVYPLGSDIATQWAQECGYPMEDSRDLARVSQYIAVTEDYMEPKDKIQREFQKYPLPDFNAPDDPYGLMAELPLPIYMTTNYDDCMVEALRSRNKEPKLELCRWNKFVKENVKSVFKARADYSPTPANPIVFHLHGNINVPESLVLTEDDYLDFLVNLSKDQGLLPSRITMAMTGSSLLFLGYRLADLDFRVLFRGVISYLEKTLQRTHVSVQIAPGRAQFTEEQQDKAQQYLIKYFDKLDIRIYWGTCREFTAELRNRWVHFNYGN